ncbi:MAG: hypothetical protein ACJ790_08030, partial [Myxococcaceae bacterium]
GLRRVSTALLLVSASGVLSFSYFNNISSSYYFVYRSWVASLCVGLVGIELVAWKRRWALAVLAVAVVIVVGVNLAKDVVWLRTARAGAREWAALQSATSAKVSATDRIIGLEEGAFLVSMAPNYRADENFGFYSHQRPDVLLLPHKPQARASVSAFALGGACIGDEQGKADYLQFHGPSNAAMLEKDLSQLCAYFAALDARSRTLYQGADYELLRVERGP